MSQEYTIVKVSDQPPQEWKHGISYYKVMVDGHPKPIEVGKKKKPDVGDTLYGNIQVQAQEMTDKFQRVERPDGGYVPPSQIHSVPASKPAYQPKDEEAIKAMFAIKGAIAFKDHHAFTETPTVRGVEEIAKQLFSMVDRVKTGGAVEEVFGELPPVEVYDNVPADEDFDKDEVDLSTIPF